MKLSLIKFNVDKYILAISPSKLIITGFYEVMKCYYEFYPPILYLHWVFDFSSLVSSYFDSDDVKLISEHWNFTTINFKNDQIFHS